MIMRKDTVPSKRLSKETNSAIYPVTKDNITRNPSSIVIATLSRITAYATISQKNETFFMQDDCSSHLAGH